MNRYPALLLQVVIATCAVLETSATASASDRDNGVKFHDDWSKNGVVQRRVQPIYPYEGRRFDLKGSGQFICELRPDGSVARVRVAESTGHSVLDNAAIMALKQWRFKPGVFSKVRIPVNFTLEIADWVKVPNSVRPFVIESPAPRSNGIVANGSYKILVTRDGSVSAVSVLQSTGDKRLDRVAIAAFRRWRFQAGAVHQTTIGVAFGESTALRKSYKDP
jgi:TonB family protein